MNTINTFLKVSTRINADELSELEKLTSEYPWFSLAHQLVLVGYKQNDNPQFAEKCKQTAIYTLNRKRLYNFLEKSAKYTPQPVIIENSESIDNNVPDTPDYSENDDLLLNFSHEYFSIEDLPPIEATEDEQEESNDQLITKFITENPRIVPKISPISDLDNLIQLDDDFDEEPVSETLANIYASQGFYDKAISAYEKLSLLNPEKNTYFASLIRELKNKQK